LGVLGSLSLLFPSFFSGFLEAGALLPHTQKYVMGVEACHLGGFIKPLGAAVKTKHAELREPGGAGFWLSIGWILIVAIGCFLYLYV
jgi:hypothetical protein